MGRIWWVPFCGVLSAEMGGGEKLTATLFLGGLLCHFALEGNLSPDVRPSWDRVDVARR